MRRADPFLLSDDGSFITATDLAVDGGYMGMGPEGLGKTTVLAGSAIALKQRGTRQCDFPIVDTHLHVWDPAHLRYPWLEDIPFLNKPYLLEDYRAACGPIAVEKMVFVQCEADFSPFMEEAEWVPGWPGRRTGASRGSCPGRPLEKGDAARPDLEKLRTQSADQGHPAHHPVRAGPGVLPAPGIRAGRAGPADYGLHFDICINHRQMANTIEMVRQCPNVTFILDHIGKPDIKNHVLEPWKRQISRPWPGSPTCGARCRAWSPKPTTSTGPGKT